MEFNFMEERVDDLNTYNFTYSNADMEGRELCKNLASAQFTLKLSPSADGGSIVTHVCKFDTLPGVSLEEGILAVKAAYSPRLSPTAQYSNRNRFTPTRRYLWYNKCQ
ncbi:hypothetical protein SUGI_0133070 [Cryptomeria japonica]|nr:hypothetical protein SUGI_0133070 [Cryptomeria japonica]